MKNKFKKLWQRQWNKENREIAPDEIFLDSKNLPDFDIHQFEGRLERPISQNKFFALGFFFILVIGIFSYRLWSLQIKQGEAFAERSENNSLRHTLVFADRGVIYDRNSQLLAWNVENPEETDFSFRQYSTTTGLANLLGYIQYPSKDSAGFYYREDYVGVDGVEKVFNEELKGVQGLKITETNAFGAVESQSVLNPPETGTNVVLSIDARIQNKLHEIIKSVATQYGFTGGAGVIMDVKTGEILTEVTYPEYNSQVLSDGNERDLINGYFTDNANPLLNRSTAGLYTPGSIVKPIVALAALNEGVINPNTVIYTNGQLVVPNPYDPSKPTIFRDWRNHGPVDMREALQVSSDVYFYQVGGGFEGQRGVGIANIEKYMRMFGFGAPPASEFFGTKEGVIPNPEWKEKNFDGEPWRVGNTYHTAIGQYGFQVTPIQVARATAAIANKGIMVEPTILAHDKKPLQNAKVIDIPEQHFNVIHEGMRMSAVDGTARALNMSTVEIAAKTGTAELGARKEYVNSWVNGFFPYQNPRYAFVILMERGSAKNLVGSSFVARQLFDWMAINTPEYLH